MMQKKSVDVWVTTKNALPFFKQYWGLVLWIFLLAFIIEATIVSERFLFKIIVDRGTEFSNGIIEKWQVTEIFMAIACVFIALLVLRSASKWVFTHLLIILDSSLISDIKRKFFNHLIHLPYRFHTTHKTGSLIVRLNRGGRALETIADTIAMDMSSIVFQLVIASTAVFFLSWSAAVAICSMILVFLLYSLFIQKFLLLHKVRAIEAEDAEKASVADIFTNIESVKYFGKEEGVKNVYWRLSEETKKKMLRHWSYYRQLDAGQFLIVGTGTFFVLFLPLREFLAGDITLGSVVAIYTVYTGLISPMYRFVHGMRKYNDAAADFDSLYQYIDEKNEIADLPDAKDLVIGDGVVEFKNVTFGYHQKKLFSRFHLKIEKNQRVAIVGHSGAGKSTLIKLLYRLYDVDDGGIFIDGTDIRSVKQESLRENLSIVPQECVLFDDTIYNNIAFSNPRASREEVLQAMRFAQLDRIVASFPQQESTIVGERGVRLSGGEKQRVSIARALLANKKILVLDEATSSLDSQTEHEIQKDLDHLMKNRTTIIIAHRLSTIMKADRIVVVDGGKIVQSGSHNELIKKKGQYKMLWDLQKGGYIG